MKRARKIAAWILLGLAILCMGAVAGLALSNLGLDQRSAVTEWLSEADKARLAETQNLLRARGDAVWPGWGQAELPAILYNEEYVFLVGYPNPPAGWIKVPAGIQRGGPWELAPADEYLGAPYYRQRLPGKDSTPEAFTVLVGERWTYSLQTLEWALTSLQQTIRGDLPGFLRPIFPYRIFLGQLVSGSDQYITLLAHEAFHAYQGRSAPERLAEAERANQEYEGRYPWDDPSLQADWQAELDLLAEALRSEQRAEMIALAGRFLEHRQARRERAGLAPELANYEKQREWLEGLARYAELEIWRQAADGTYTPVPETRTLSDFDGYKGFDQRWAKEIRQISLMANDEGDGRFYYSGMAQAFLLDRLAPGWKTEAFAQGAWLEDLLAKALQAHPES